MVFLWVPAVAKLILLVDMVCAPYAVACAVIQARTCPACQAVTLALNLVGFGNLPSFTIRHSVGAENGRGAIALSVLLGLRTNCASRSHAESGSRSNTACVGAVCAVGAVALGLVVLAVLGLLLKLKPFDIVSVLMKVDGFNVVFFGVNVTAVAVLHTASAVSGGLQTARRSSEFFL